jgi:hypothetical protein
MNLTELRVVVPDEIAERLASEAAEQGTSPEAVAAEVLQLHVPAPHGVMHIPSWVGAVHSGRDDLSERHEEVLRSELGHEG